MQKTLGIIASLCLVLFVNAANYDLQMSAPIDGTNEWSNPDVAPPWQIQPEPGKTEGEVDLTIWNTGMPVYPTSCYRGMSCVDDSGFFYALGGQSPILGTMYRFSPYTSTWQTMPSMPGVCANQFAVWWKDGNGIGTDSSCIIVLGRYSPTYAKTCYRWTKATNTWDTIPQFPGSASYVTGAMGGAIGDTVYCMVRQTSTGGNLWYGYNVRTGVWATCATPPVATNYYGAACTYGGRIWQLGGWTNSQAFQVYRPGTGWTLLTTPPANIGGNSGQIAGHNGKIFAWGGGNGWVPWNGYAFYDTVSGTWTAEANLPTAVGYAFYGAVQMGGMWGIHNAAGYCPSQGTAHYRGVWVIPSATDVGMSAILYPAGPTLGPNVTFQPKGLVKNYGTGAMTNIPVHCLIDSSGTNIRHDSITIATLNAGDTVTASFPSFTSGATGSQYLFTMYTNAVIDSLRGNDTLTRACDVIPWIDIAAPANTPDRLTHATMYNPVTDRIYMIGGTPNGTSGTNVNLTQEYNPTTNTWTDRATMTTALGWISAPCVRGVHYVIGGYNNSAAATNTNYRYDATANTWSTRLNRPRIAACDLGGVVWRDSLVYTLGGTNLSIGWTFVDIYNPFTNTWALGTAMPLPGDMGGAAIIGDTIYIPNALNRGASSCWPNLVQGAINPTTPTQITWTTGPAHSYPTFDAGATTLRGDVYWLGGFLYASSVTDMFWKYERATGTIVTLENYPVTLARCHYLTARPSEPAIYVIAGDSGGNWAAPNRKYYKYVLPPVHDVGTTYLGLPTGSILPGATVTPTCSLYNYGDAAETYLVRMKIGAVYNETLTVAAHPLGTTVGLTFPSWTAVSGNYVVSCSTELAADANNANDRMTGSLVVSPPPAQDWKTLAPIPTTPSGKNPKAGSCMAGLEATGKVYFLKASNKPDFAGFTPAWPDAGAWADLETIPKGDKATFDGKYPKKGASMAAYDPHKCLYVLRGNNTQGFWKYQADTLAGDTASIGWKKMLEIPLGAKAPKDASGMALVTKNDSDQLFVMKGSKTDEFYFYNIEANTWMLPAVQAPPAGTSGKIGYKKGSCLAYDGEKTVYVLKGNYGDFFKFDIDSLKWTELTRYDKKIFINRDGKKKAPKDGAALVFHEGFIYMLKGGNTRELWKYNTLADTGTWVQMNPDILWDIPLGGGKKVKGGGAMIKFGDYLYASKGGNTQEFYGHGVPFESVAVSYKVAMNGALGNKVANEFSLTVAPNPAINVTAIRYNLPAAGAVSFKLYNVAGSLVKTYTNAVPTKNGLITIDAKALPSGVYILRFNAGDIRVTRKLVLEK